MRVKFPKEKGTLHHLWCMAVRVNALTPICPHLHILSFSDFAFSLSKFGTCVKVVPGVIFVRKNAVFFGPFYINPSPGRGPVPRYHSHMRVSALT